MLESGRFCFSSAICVVTGRKLQGFAQGIAYWNIALLKQCGAGYLKG